MNEHKRRSPIVTLAMNILEVAGWWLLGVLIFAAVVGLILLLANVFGGATALIIQLP